MIFRKSTLLALCVSSSVNCIWAAAPVDVAVTKKLPQEIALDRFNAFNHIAMEKTGALREHGVLRKAKKDGQAKIVLTHNQIYFNVREIKIGNSIASWKK
jgi:hypothetical protein